MRWRSAIPVAWLVAMAGAGGLLPGTARADIDVVDLWDTGNLGPGTVYPNWAKTWVGDYVVDLCNLADCPDVVTVEQVTGLTVVNFGTALPADVKTVYFQLSCGGISTGLVPMTYAGLYAEDTGIYPAWTWGGLSPDLSGCPVMCVGCLDGAFSVDLYVDVAACPQDGVDLKLGFPFHGNTNPVNGGSLTDNHDQAVPWDDVIGPDETVRYMSKTSDVDTVAPGDTITYTIFYGRPGTGPLSSIVVFDTMPAYSHFVTGSAVPAPDAFWGAPNTGPPATLQWTQPGPLATTGGPTAMITFAVTVDWGNGESFEPGSGDAAAPEGPGFTNVATAFFNGAGCPVNVMAASAGATVQRYLFWKIGDNDVLYASRYGSPDDEMIYSIFARNMSATKTWWNVAIWDTVPTQLDIWSPGYGFEDPCAGWTMTPTGCASAAPGWRPTVPSRTLLTWTLDMPPGATLQVRWKARVSPTAPLGATAINVAAIEEGGHPGIVGGSGSAWRPRIFVHEAAIVLRTTYLSYVGTGSANTKWGQCEPFIVFFPLNKATDFELRGLEYQGAVPPFPVAGGASASIGPLIGTCTGGLFCPGSTGCGIARAPTHYSRWSATCAPNSGHSPACPAFPFHFIYKLTSNSPVLWTVMELSWDQYDDGHTYTPATSLSFCGLTHYVFLRHSWNAPQYGDMLNIVNTSLNVYGAYDPNLDTTVHIFQWDPVSQTWIHQETYELDPESLVTRPPVPDLAGEGYYRILSSQGQLICHAWANALAQVFNHMAPNRETGAMTSKVGPGYTFYVFPGNEGDMDRRVMVTNTGAVTATYRIDWYRPRNTAAAPPGISPWQADTSGRWITGPVMTVDPGLATVGANANAHGYGPPYDPSYGFNTPNGDFGAWRIVQLDGGPIQVCTGAHFMGWFGGSVLHAANGDQTGKEFWVSQLQTEPYKAACNNEYSIYAIDLFCPRQNMAVQAVSSDGYSATFTTTGPDQCVAFTWFTLLGAGAKRNIKVDLLGTGAQGNMVAMYLQCADHQRMYTAPYVLVGVHYDILTPPVAFVGQSFWITVLVVDSGGGTKDDYCGVTSFTSTDPTAKLMGTPMDAYNFTWASSIGCSGSPNQNGVMLFANVTLNTLGVQTIVGSDVVDGSVTGLAAVMVVGTDVKLQKFPPMQVAASGDTVQFRLCWSNYSSSSAFGFTLTDAVPQGTTYLPEVPSAMSCGNSAGLVLTTAYSTVASGAPPPSFATLGGGPPPANTAWLRWTVPAVGVSTTGCACFRVTVQ